MKQMMRAITHDRYVDFVLTHWKDVHAFLDSVERAKERLPPWLVSQIRDIFKALQQTYLNKPTWYACDQVEANCIWWDTCNKYDREADTGPYIGFYYSNELSAIWDWLTTGELATVPQIIFDVELQGTIKTKRATRRAWFQHLQKHLLRLRRSGINIGAEEGDDFLATYDLGGVFTLNNIQVVGGLQRSFAKAVMHITDTLHPIIKTGPR